MAKLLNLQLIVTDIQRGIGSINDPMRQVQQWFTPDGTLVLEYDIATDTAESPMAEYLRRVEDE